MLGIEPLQSQGNIILVLEMKSVVLSASIIISCNNNIIDILHKINMFMGVKALNEDRVIYLKTSQS